MPRFRCHYRYIVARSYPGFVEFAGIRYFLEVVKEHGVENTWTFRARKDAPGPAQVRVLTRSLYGRYALESAMHSHGFVVQNDSANGMIMERLQMMGYAASQHERGCG